MPSRSESLAASVVVAARDRPIRLRWLLNALGEQTVAPERVEVIVAHDPASAATGELLCTHPLRAAGSLHSVAVPGGSTHLGAGRNAAWRRANAPLVLFTEDDCRPAAEWIEQALSAATEHPGAILQGTTVPDPYDATVARTAPWVHTRSIRPPSPWAETCNIAYPREVLERLGGFDESMLVGEDTDLALRARRLGSTIVGAPHMLVYHAVDDQSLPDVIRSQCRWQDLALLVKRYPSARRQMWGLIWSRPQDAALTAAAAGLVGARRSPWLAVTTLPWIAWALVHHGYGYRPRALLRAVSELPGRALIDGALVLALLRGSLRHRALLL